jgi:hypothetical protein
MLKNQAWRNCIIYAILYQVCFYSEMYLKQSITNRFQCEPPGHCTALCQHLDGNVKWDRHYCGTIVSYCNGQHHKRRREYTEYSGIRTRNRMFMYVHAKITADDFSISCINDNLKFYVFTSSVFWVVAPCSG